jgi:hypothetical protein
MTSVQFATKMAAAQLRDTPFTTVKAVDLSGGNYTPAADFQVTELRCKTAGAIKVDTANSTGETILMGDYDLLPIQITKIYQTGTDAGLVTGAIVVYGFSIANDLSLPS